MFHIYEREREREVERHRQTQTDGSCPADQQHQALRVSRSSAAALAAPWRPTSA